MVREQDEGGIFGLCGERFVAGMTMLEEKTKQCLDSDEARLLEGILYELRMKYVMKKVD